MKTLSKALFVTTLSLLAVVPAYADNPYRNDNYRDEIKQLEMRIERGMDRHELTRDEARELKNEYRSLRHMYRDFHDDGRLSRKERHRLDHEIDRLNDQIKRYKHNHWQRQPKPKYQSEHQPERHDYDRWDRETDR